MDRGFKLQGEDIEWEIQLGFLSTQKLNKYKPTPDSKWKN